MPTRYVRYAVAALSAGLILSSAAIAQDRYNRKVDVINDTSVTMVEFFASNIDVDDWEEDILGEDLLRPGAQMSVNIDDGTGYCLYDLKAVFADGDVLTEKRFNVCEEPYWRLHD